MSTDPHDVRRISELASVRHRGAMLSRNLWRHVPRISELASATALGRPLEGVTAVVVGAGPSLDKNIDVLREHAEHVCILCVNTAARALERAGIEPDVVVAIETVDVSSHIPDGWRVLTSPTAHPRIWERGTWWTIEASQATTRLCRFWGVPPGTLGVSAATTAISTAVDWGASQVLLVGMDLAAADGRMYATGSPWESVTADVQDYGEHGERVRIQSPPERGAIFEAEGVRPPSDMRSAPIEVDGWDGGKVRTVGEFWTQLNWIARRSVSSPVQIINCTEGGAAVCSSRIPLRDVMPYLGCEPFALESDNPNVRVPPERAEAAVADTLAQCNDAYAWARRYASGRWFPVPPVPSVPAVYEFSFPGLLGAGDRLSAAIAAGKTPPDAVSIGLMWRTLAGGAAHLRGYLETGDWEWQRRTDGEANSAA